MDWNAIGQAALTATVQVAVPVIATLVIGLLVQALRRVGFSISAEQHAMWEKFAQDAIARQEERDAELRKASDGLSKLTPEEKLQGAVEDVLKRLKGAVEDVLKRLKGADADRVVETIKAQLIAKGAGAAASMLQRAQQRLIATLPGGPGA